MEEIIRSACAMCHGGCGILAHIKDGKVVKIEGDPDCPVNHGSMCPQGLAATQFIYHPDRLKYPLKRAGDRGEGKWARISWDEALDTIAQRLKEIRDQYGPLAIAGGCGTGRVVQKYVRRFLHVLGTPNRLGCPHNCWSPRVAISKILFGRFISQDPENSNCIVVWGRNISHTRPGRSGKSFIDGFKNGAKLVAVDPYLTPIASKSDVWLQIRPGTDAALALAWLNVIITESLYDRDFVEKWTTGFERLARHMGQFTPEWAEQVTWVPAGKIREAARLYARNSPASLIIGVAAEFGINTTNNMLALHLLPILTGNIDIRGGNVFLEDAFPFEGVPGSHEAKISGVNLLSKETWNQAVGGFPLLLKAYPTANHAGWRAVLSGQPYPIKAVAFHASNALVDYENPKGLIREAMKKLDFSYVMDHWMTPTAEMADLVLPASTNFERDEMFFIGESPYTIAAPKLIDPLWETRDDRQVFIDVLKRMGLDYGFNTADEMVDFVASPLGMTFQEFAKMGTISLPQRYKKYETGDIRADKRPGFATPSGKIELYSKELEELQLDPLPKHKEPPDSPYSNPEAAKSFPLVFSTGPRTRVFFHSQYRQLPWLREIHPDPVVRIHPDTAAACGIKDGEWIYLESQRGRCKQKAKVTLGIDPRVVLAEHGWWFPEKEGPEHGVWDSNINLLVSSDPPYDPGCGSSPARGLLCRIYKVEEARNE